MVKIISIVSKPLVWYNCQVNPIKYLSEVKIELAQVVWPKISDVVRLTILVILISVIVGAYLGGLDAGFTKLVGLILNK
jgi:preprotein translocase SecE subunit